MENQLEFFTWTRENIASLLRSVSPEQAFSIPPGFRNSLVWNTGHIIWVQQTLVYHLAGLPTSLPDGFDKSYATGTLPQANPVSAEVLNDLIRQLELGVSKFKQDYEKGIFVNFTPLKARYDTIDYHFTEWRQAFEYNNIHEARHYGFMLGLKQCLPVE